MPAALAKILLALLPGEDLMRGVLVLLLLPILLLGLFLVGPAMVLMKVPAAGPVEIKYYQDAAEKVNQEMQGVAEPVWSSLEWEKLVAIDAVLLQQRFNLATPARAESLARRFTEIVEEKKTVRSWDEVKQEYVEKTVTYLRYKTWDEVLQDLGIFAQKHIVENYLLVDIAQLGIENEGDFSPVIGDLCWPLPGYYRISSKFGNRIHPVTGKNSFHRGIDLPAPKGSKIVAAKDGLVVSTGYSMAEGKTIVIKHDFGYTRYCHLAEYTVARGVEVKAGDKIGEVGSTGFFTTGAHLHFEVRPGNKPVDPLKYYR